MERLMMILGSVQGFTTRADDDSVDKLNYRYTTFLLSVFAIVVSTKQYVGDPITCWCPAEFKDNYEDFTNKYCWVHNTYHVPMSQKDLPGEGEPKSYIGYYQWVPMFLMMQALFFYLPCYLWRTLNDKAGIDVNDIVQQSKQLQHTAYVEEKEKCIGFISRSMNRYLKTIRDYRDDSCLAVCKHHMSRNFCMVCGSRRFGNYLVALYMVSKIFYLINVISQIFILNSFLGTSYHMYGYTAVMNAWRGEDSIDSGTFPRVTFCDFPIRDLNNIRPYTVQCVLPLNFFNEKMYLLIWFWLVMVLAANLINLFTWIIRVSSPRQQIRYIKHHLSTFEKFQINRKKKTYKLRLRRFVNDYLKQDGVLVLRLVEMNANGLVVSEIIAELFSSFQMKPIAPSAPELPDDEIKEEEM